MKISCTPISFARAFKEGQMTIERFLATCAEHGCDGVDLLDSKGYPWLWGDSVQAEKNNLATWLNEYQLELAALGCGNNFARHEQTAFEQEVDKVKFAIDEAAELDASTLRIFGGYVDGAGGESGMTAAKGLPFVFRGIERVLPYAEQANVILALENHGRLPGHAYEVKAILDWFDTPHLRCTLDIANFIGNSMDEPADPLMATHELAPYAAHVHVKDFGPPTQGQASRVEGYIPGQGAVPLRQALAVLETQGYHGYCSLEYEAGFKTPETQGVTQSLAYLCQVREQFVALNLSRDISATGHLA